MAQINFVKLGNEYVAEVKGVSGTFNVDIEREEAGRITVYQKASSATRYKAGQTIQYSDSVADLNFNVILDASQTMDYKFTSKAPVTKAIIG